MAGCSPKPIVGPVRWRMLTLGNSSPAMKSRVGKTWVARWCHPSCGTGESGGLNAGTNRKMGVKRVKRDSSGETVEVRVVIYFSQDGHCLEITMLKAGQRRFA